MSNLPRGGRRLRSENFQLGRLETSDPNNFGLGCFGTPRRFPAFRMIQLTMLKSPTYNVAR